MGQKKIKTVDLNKKEPTKGKPATKKEAKEKVKADDKKQAPAEKKEAKKSTKKTAKKTQARPRSKRYKAIARKIDNKKLHSLSEAVELLTKITNSKIDETIELHIITSKDKVTGVLNLPHGTGKTKKVVVATDALISEIKKGTINFDILIAKPEMMPKIAKVAKILGPKGLMPNPKTGTVTDKPEKIKKKLEAGETHYKTELKAPLLHLTIGKISFGKKKLLENLNEAVKQVNKNNIKKATLTSTHSPGIKLEI